MVPAREALIAVKNDAPTHHFTKFGTPGATVTNRTDTNQPADVQFGFHHRMASGEIIDGGSGMNDRVVEAAIAGATLGAGAAIWLLAGYLIQRFCLPKPRPTYATVFATSMSASMLLFSLVALLAFHIR